MSAKNNNKSNIKNNVEALQQQIRIDTTINPAEDYNLKAHVDKSEELKRMIIDIYHKKNGDYGNSHERTFKQFGSVSYMTRLSDKYSRLESLIMNNNNAFYEPIEDTMLDAYIYAIMWKAQISPSSKKFVEHVLNIQLEEWVDDKTQNTVYFLEAFKTFIEGIVSTYKSTAILDCCKNQHYLIYLEHFLNSVHPSI